MSGVYAAAAAVFCARLAARAGSAGGLAILLFSCLACSGCAGDGPAAEAGGGSFDSVQRIFSQSCLDAGCHNATDRLGNLVLEPGFTHAELVDVSPTNTFAAADGLLRVAPNDPNRSLLLIKLVDPPDKYESRMPQGKPPLSNADIDLVRAWINEGAPGPMAPAFTRTATATTTATQSATLTATLTPSATATPTITISPTPSISPTGTLPPSPTVTLTATRTATRTASPTASATEKPTILPGSTFAEIQQNIFNASCLNEGCHNLTDQAGGQVLDAESSYAQLVNVTPTLPNAVARGLLRVKPGDPDASFLYIKLSLPRAFDPVFSARMPQAAPALPSEQIEQVRAWILRGALSEE